MGREVKRVPLDFKWHMNQIWKGYVNPYNSIECKACDGTGESEQYKKLSDDWYGFDRPDCKWCNDITQDEVRALLAKGRLMDFTRVPVNEKQKTDVKNKISEGGNSWLPYNNGVIPTAKQVNRWNKDSMLGHDGINKWICVETRAKRMGITETACPYCNGEGNFYAEGKFRKLSEEYQYIEPPKGDGWQMWETTSEGSPMSPVFKKPQELARWLVDNNASSFGRSTATYEQWMSMIDQGWAVSAVLTKGELKSGVEDCDLTTGENR